MSIAMVSKIQMSVREWLGKAPLIALMLAIAAFGPLVSFEQAQHQQQTILAAHSLQDLTAGGTVKKVSLVGLMMVGGAIFTAGTYVLLVARYAVIDLPFPRGLGQIAGLGIIAVGWCVFGFGFMRLEKIKSEKEAASVNSWLSLVRSSSKR